MAKRRKKRRVYILHEKERRRWRVVTISPTGERDYEKAESQRDAERLRDTLLEAAEYAPTFDEVITQFIHEFKVDHVTWDTANARLRAFFKPVIDEEAFMLTPKEGAKLYATYRKTKTRTGMPPATDTHHNTLAQAKRLFDWMIEKKLATINPLADIKKVGKKNQGKEQLNDEEAALFWTTSLRLASDGDVGALPGILALVFGLRAGEISGLQKRDVTAFSLYVKRSKKGASKGKTKAATRRLRMPEELANLMHWAKNQTQGEYIFGDRHWVGYHVRRLCKLAGVTVVSPHGLRGTAATLATESGQIGTAVIHSLGHTSFDVTKAHYLAPGTMDRVASRNTLAFLSDAQNRIPNRIPADPEAIEAGTHLVHKGGQPNENNEDSQCERGDSNPHRGTSTGT